MTQTIVAREQTSFTPTALITLYQLDGTTIGMPTIFYFCDGVRTNFQPVVFNGITYFPLPINIDSFGTNGTGTLPRPRLSVSNINGFISALLLQNENLVGAVVTRIRVFARFLDAVNFPNGVNPYGTPDPSAAYPPEPYYINRKITENPQIVQFELASVLEMQNVKLPRRLIIANTCTWKYRDTLSCNYSGVPIADQKNKVFGTGGYGLSLTDKGAYNAATTYAPGDYVVIYSNIPQFSNIPVYYVCISASTGIYPVNNPGNWVADSCAKSIAACKLRFTNTPLRGSFFPGVTRAGFV